MVSKRPFKWTTQETASVFFGIGFLIVMVTLYSSFGVIYTATGSYKGFIVPAEMLLFIGVGMFFMFLGYFYPCYQISRWECNIFMDKLEPGW